MRACFSLRYAVVEPYDISELLTFKILEIPHRSPDMWPLLNSGKTWSGHFAIVCLLRSSWSWAAAVPSRGSHTLPSNHRYLSLDSPMFQFAAWPRRWNPAAAAACFIFSGQTTPAYTSSWSHSFCGEASPPMHFFCLSFWAKCIWTHRQLPSYIPPGRFQLTLPSLCPWSPQDRGIESASSAFPPNTLHYFHNLPFFIKR